MIPTLVLVHGCGKTHRFWDDLLPEIGDVPVLAPSLPGRPPTGGSALESATEAAAWLQAHLENERVEHAIVVGHSFGGAVAIEYALRRPPNLAGLGLVCTGARLRVLPAILEVTAAAARNNEHVDLSAFVYRPETDSALIRRVEDPQLAAPPATTATDWQATNRFDRLGALETITTDVLIVGGTADRLTPPKYAHYLAEHIPGAALHFVEDAGHMLPIEHASPLGRLLRDFATSGTR